MAELLLAKIAEQGRLVGFGLDRNPDPSVEKAELSDGSTVEVERFDHGFAIVKSRESRDGEDLERLLIGQVAICRAMENSRRIASVNAFKGPSGTFIYNSWTIYDRGTSGLRRFFFEQRIRTAHAFAIHSIAQTMFEMCSELMPEAEPITAPTWHILPLEPLTVPIT